MSKQLMLSILLLAMVNVTQAQPLDQNIMEHPAQAIEYLKKNGYTQPDQQSFNASIKAIFGVYLGKYPPTENNILMGTKTNMQDGSNSDLFIVLKNERYIYSPSVYIDTDKPDEATLHLNKYLFNSNSASFRYLLNRRDGGLMYLMSRYGYVSPDHQDDLLKLIDDSWRESEDFVWSLFFGREGAFGKFKLRRNLVELYWMHTINRLSSYLDGLKKHPQMYGNQESFIMLFIETGKFYYLEDIQYMEGYEGNRDEDTAFLMEWLTWFANQTYRYDFYNAEIYFDMPVIDVKRLYDADLSIQDRLRKKDYYGYKLLKEYSENQYNYDNNWGMDKFGNEHEPDYGVIKDPDGYVNVRKEKSTKSPVIARINSGTKVQILSYETSGSRKPNKWYYIQVPDKSLRGYVHHSRVDFTLKLFNE